MRFACSWVLGLATLVACSSEPAAEETPRRRPRPTAADFNPSKALGDLSVLDPRSRAAFEAGPEDFPPLPEPEAGDWLAQHNEPPQSVGNFWVSEPNKPGVDGRSVLYILPLGEVPMTTDLKRHATAFFDMPVKVLPTVELEAMEVTNRDRSSGPQWLAPDIQQYLQSNLPEDAYAMVGVTMVDLYPRADYNFVFGLASPRKRTGVFSFARYDPRFGNPDAAPDPNLVRRRALKILAHEVGHMFGMLHCVHHACALNGTNHLDELDEAPPHLCPVCLRKLHLLTDVDLEGRYRSLELSYAEAEWPEAAEFVRRRRKRINAAVSVDRSR